MTTTFTNGFLLGIAFLAAVPAAGVLAQAPATVEHPTSLSVREEQDGRVELTLEGTSFTSRDHLERSLLRHAALLTRQRGQDWFMLLHLPGEGNDHPPRANPDGLQFSHWQPHWSYLATGAGWQPWHPEWSAPFWTSSVDPSTIERFQLHAMIELGRGPAPAYETAFDAKSVLHDLSS